MFAADLVTSGLLIRIGAALESSQRADHPRGSVAMIDNEVVRPYRIFLDTRRRAR
jgi:hypothetical protein